MTEAAAQAMRTATQSTQAAEVAAREARDAANSAASAKEKAQRLAEAAPKVVDRPKSRHRLPPKPGQRPTNWRKSS